MKTRRERQFAFYKNMDKDKKIIFVDIDGTICTEEQGNYEAARPIKSHVEKINQLYEDGHTIIYWTARGTVTGIDWEGLTKRQFKEWGVKYHELRVGTKPHYDLWVDDKCKRIEEI